LEWNEPEHPLLEKPTVRDITQSLKAERISGEPDAFDGLVRHFKVAAMELPHFLDHLEEGSLVIVPGDRSDMSSCPKGRRTVFFGRRRSSS